MPAASPKSSRHRNISEEARQMPRLKDPEDPTQDPGSDTSRIKTRMQGGAVGEILADRSHRPGQMGPGRIMDLPTASRERPSCLTRPERDWDGTLMAEIEQPECEIDVRPAEHPLPSARSAGPSAAGPRPEAGAGGAMRRPAGAPAPRPVARAALERHFDG